MTDLDFEELDKAVNSLMASPSMTAPQLDDSPKPTDTPQVEAPVSEKVNEEVAPATPAPASTAATSSVPLAKRRGRFMDVVHPSSDMKAEVRTSSSREGVAIAPPSTSSPDSVGVAPIAADEPAPVQSAVTQPSVETTNLPDPLDTYGDTGMALPTEPDDQDMSKQSAEPLSSPFLPDAKVEKRPLGGGIAGDFEKLLTDDADPVKAADVTIPNESEATTVEQNDTLLPQEEIANTLPAELNSDLVAIEAAGATHNLSEAATPPESTMPTEETIQVSDVAKTPSVEEKESKSERTTPAAVTGSIPQQYKEQPSSSDESHASIYDAETQAAPLAHPPKKKAGWLLYFIIFLLVLVVGGGGGAAIYFLNLAH